MLESKALSKNPGLFLGKHLYTTIKETKKLAITVTVAIFLEAFIEFTIDRSSKHFKEFVFNIKSKANDKMAKALLLVNNI